MVPPVGKHCILELHACPSSLLNDVAFVRDTVERASEQGMSTLLKLVSNQFEPQGVTALALLAESHISIHTWPEHGYGAVDIFTCGEHADPERACHFIVSRFEAGDYRLRVLARGGEGLAPHADDAGNHSADQDSADQEHAPCQAPDSMPTSGSPNTSARPTCTTTA